MYEVWTDGSYRPSINQGGYSAVITQNGELIKKIHQGFKDTTNNRMELRAVLETLKWFTTPEEIIIYSDSQYVVSNINNKCLNRWIVENDPTIKNMDIWREVHSLLGFHSVRFIWIKGHSGNTYNELADLLAQHSANCLNLEKDDYKN